MMISDSDSPKHFDASAATLEQEVLQRSMTTPILIDFWAPWCGPCKQLKPVLEKLADEYAGSFLLAKVNSDDEMQLASLFGVRSLPTVILVKDGQPVDPLVEIPVGHAALVRVDDFLLGGVTHAGLQNAVDHQRRFHRLGGALNGQVVTHCSLHHQTKLKK